MPLDFPVTVTLSPSLNESTVISFPKSSLSILEENTKTLFIDSNINPEIDKNQNIVIKVRTESFDKT